MELNGTITENRADLGGTITAKKTLTGALAPTGGSAGPVVVTRGTGANSLIGVNTINPNTATGAEAIALGGNNQSTAPGAVTIGTNNVASAQNAVAIGSKLAGADPNTASGTDATALGLSCLSSGYGSVAVGYNTTASNTGSFSSGYQTTASGQAAATTGYLSTASGTASVALGQEATATATAAAAIGRETTASGAASTALGRGTTASASQALAAGRDTKAEAVAATALGYGTDATGARSLVAGAYNAPDANAVDTTHGSGARKYLMIIGNGTADTARSNAATLDWDGNAVFAGKATVGAAPTADMDVATKKYVDDNSGSVTVDTALSTTSTNPVQNKVITAALATKADQAGIQQVIEDEVDDWLSVQAPSIGTLSYAAKQALLACFRHVAWIDDQGQSYYNALESELFPDATLESITAVFTQGSAVIYDTDSLDTLRQYLVVTATFSDSTTAVVSDYTLSGTLTAGTSTITVSYGGKTDTFTVTVSIGLDSVAYGTMTYRDIFVTNNLYKFGDFEHAMTIDSTWRTAEGNWMYKSNAGSPVRSTEAANSPTHSLKCFGTGSTQIAYNNNADYFSGSYLCCVAVKVDRYVKGNAGIQVITPLESTIERTNIAVTTTTQGFVAAVGIHTTAASRKGMGCYTGTYTSANCDTYVDDVVITPLPSGMTQAEGETLYANYLEIVGRAS